MLDLLEHAQTVGVATSFLVTIYNPIVNEYGEIKVQDVDELKAALKILGDLKK